MHVGFIIGDEDRPSVDMEAVPRKGDKVRLDYGDFIVDHVFWEVRQPKGLKANVHAWVYLKE